MCSSKDGTRLACNVVKRFMKIADLSELKKDLQGYLDGVIHDSEPLVVHRSANKSVVVLPFDEYNAIQETEYIMRSPAMMEVMHKGDEEIQGGKGKPVRIDELWK